MQVDTAAVATPPPGSLAVKQTPSARKPTVAAAAPPIDTVQVTPFPWTPAPTSEASTATQALSQQMKQERLAKNGPQYDAFMQAYQQNFARWSELSGGRTTLSGDDVHKLLAQAQSPQEKAALQAMTIQTDVFKGTPMSLTFNADGTTVRAPGNTQQSSLHDMVYDGPLGDSYVDAKNFNAFTQHFNQDFQAWDQRSGGKGYLTMEDVDRLMLDPSINGQDGATLATLKRLQSAANASGRQLAFSPAGTTAAPLSDGTQRGAVMPWNGSAQIANVGELYGSAMDNISSTPDRLFASPDGLPHVEDVHQGYIGNCYFVAPLASLTSQDPQAVKKMISQNGDGTYTVRFPGIDHAVSVAAPTAAELGTYGTSGPGGLWQSVLMKAYGQSQMDANNPVTANNDADRIEPYDGMNVWGKDVNGMMALTGQGIDSGMLTPNLMINIGQDPATDTQIAAFMNAGPADFSQLRASLQSTLAQHRPVTATTGNGAERWHLVPQHAYSVVGYDPQTDRVTVRNPWGNNGKYLESLPADAIPGKQNDGTFSLSLQDFTRMFSTVTMGTNGPMNIRQPIASPTQ